MKILLAGAIMDFYVNRKRYEAYKTEAGRKNYVYSVLSKYTSQLKGLIVNGIEVRDVSITSNNFWGEDLHIVPDLDYSCNNEVPELPEDSNEVPIRMFMMDLVGAMENEAELKDLFFKVKDKNFVLTISNTKVV